MKQIILCILMMLAIGTVSAQSYTKTSSNTFTAVKVERAKDTTAYQPTGNYYVAKDGKQYEIYLHTCKKGEHKGETFCYILRTSAKTGKPYWKRIDVKPEELSK